MQSNSEKMEVNSTTLYPRSLGSSLRRINQPLAVVGFISQVNVNKCSFILEYDQQSKDNLVIIVPPNQDITEFKKIKYVQVRGYLSSHGEITMKSYTDFGQNFDLPTYNEMLRLATKQFRTLFNY